MYFKFSFNYTHAFVKLIQNFKIHRLFVLDQKSLRIQRLSVKKWSQWNSRDTGKEGKL